MSKQRSEGIKKIMNVEEEMIRLLPKLDDRLGLLNPWVRQLPGIFRGLGLKRNQTVLDIPCGKGGVSIPLAKKYGLKIIGFDIVEEYIESASSRAQKNGVANLCTFNVGDIRQTTKRKNICDLLLWIAPPHLWKTSKQTMKALRNCVKNEGFVLIADAYLYQPTNKYKDYETLDSTHKGYTAFGDSLVKFIDYKSALWEEDYNRARKSAREAIKRIEDVHDRKIVSRYLRSLDKDEASDTKHMGLGIWIIQINK